MSMTAEVVLHTYRRPRRSRRPRNVRRGESPADIRAVAKAYRVKEGALPDNALHELYGTTIGRLRLEESISESQLNTAESYLRCVVAHARLLGIPSPHPKALDLLMASGGLSCESEPDAEWVLGIRRQFSDARRALLDCGQALGIGSQVNRIVYGVIVENWPRYSIGSRDVQNLRCGLNALGRVFR